MEGLATAALAGSTIVVGYAALWLIRHERAVRRLRAQFERPTTLDRR